MDDGISSLAPSKSIEDEEEFSGLSDASLLGHVAEPKHTRQVACITSRRALLWISHMALLSISGAMLLAAIFLKRSIPQKCLAEHAEWCESIPQH